MSPSLRDILVLQWDPRSFWNLQRSPASSSSSLPSCRLCPSAQRRPPLRADQRPPPACADLPRVALKLLTAIALHAVPSFLCHAPQIHPPAATSPPPCPARQRTPALLLSRAAALQEPPRANPFALLPFPRSDAPERRRHPQNAGAPRPAIDPPLHSRSA